MVNKREYNSDRRRKSISFCLSDIFLLIRENITPRGDGNLLIEQLVVRMLVYK